VSQGKSGLEHQKFKPENTKDDFNTWYQKGAFQTTVVTKYRKGACTNCGATTHNSKSIFFAYF
jgi:pre-mRNA-processing factor SLU7